MINHPTPNNRSRRLPPAPGVWPPGARRSRHRKSSANPTGPGSWAVSNTKKRVSEKKRKQTMATVDGFLGVKKKLGWSFHYNKKCGGDLMIWLWSSQNVSRWSDDRNNMHRISWLNATFSLQGGGVHRKASSSLVKKGSLDMVEYNLFSVVRWKTPPSMVWWVLFGGLLSDSWHSCWKLCDSTASDGLGTSLASKTLPKTLLRFNSKGAHNHHAGD